MTEISLRPATPADMPTIIEFNMLMAKETEGVALDRARLERGVSAVLTDGTKGFYTLAEIDGEVVGQILVTFEWSEWRAGNFWWIQSVYVKPGMRRHGVFRTLYEHVKKMGSTHDCCGIRLYVERHNQVAQEVYRKLGMSATVYELFEQDFVLHRALQPSTTS